MCVRAYQWRIRAGGECGLWRSFILLFFYFWVNRFPTIKKDLDISAKSSFLFLFLTIVVAAAALVGRFILFFYSEMCC